MWQDETQSSWTEPANIYNYRSIGGLAAVLLLDFNKRGISATSRQSGRAGA